jgi:hypothetical protein
VAYDCLLRLSLISEVFSMAPLGIITALVSAIRVAGPTWLKVLVGRRTETMASVEMDLLSSVSDEVCELWNGKAIVRVSGQQPVMMIVHIPKSKGDLSPHSFVTLEKYTHNLRLGYCLGVDKKKGRHSRLSKILPFYCANNKELFSGVDIAETPNQINRLQQSIIRCLQILLSTVMMVAIKSSSFSPQLL